MYKKILIGIALLSILFLSGCSSNRVDKQSFCKSKGYEDYYYASDHNCGNIFSCGSFFCYKPTPQGMVISDVYSGENYNNLIKDCCDCCNPKDKCDDCFEPKPELKQNHRFCR